MNYISLRGTVFFFFRKCLIFYALPKILQPKAVALIKSGIVHRRHHLIISAPLLCHNLLKKKLPGVL